MLLPYGAAAASPAVAAGDCQYVLGFKTLHDAIRNVVGDCLTSEYHNAQNGDGLQRTTRGLLVWRKADNYTAFTDGYRAWINGPYGMQNRLNSQRYPWEHDADMSHPDHSGMGTPTSSPSGSSAQPHDQNRDPEHAGEPGMHQ